MLHHTTERTIYKIIKLFTQNAKVFGFLEWSAPLYINNFYRSVILMIVGFTVR